MTFRVGDSTNLDRWLYREIGAHLVATPARTYVVSHHEELPALERIMRQQGYIRKKGTQP